ncbi:hypothetical protein JCM8547_000975 [Rhodosporidiobolus lusitaniae]
MPARPHLAVKLANKASPDDLLVKLRTNYGASTLKDKRVELRLKENKPASLAVHTTKTLTSAERNWVWELFEVNMRSLYEASADGYDPAEKKKELFHPDSRFLILYSPSPSSPACQKPTSVVKDEPLGYCIFRFDTEETASDEGDRLCDVAYCYELQVSSLAKRLGVGRALMDVLERLSAACKMDKTMLTVFKANKEAISFYESLGFRVDEIDPSEYEGGEAVDYVIRSKTSGST